MFSQAVPGSQQTMDEYMNAPVDKVAEECWELMGHLTKKRALDFYDANPEAFTVALEGALERQSNERKAQQLREEMGMMTDETLHEMRCDPNLMPCTRQDIDAEVRDRRIRERIVDAAVRAIQNDTRICWSNGLAEEDKLHVLWKHCQQCVLHSNGAPGPPDFDRFMDFKRNSASTSALSACMEKVEKAISRLPGQNLN